MIARLARVLVKWLHPLLKWLYSLYSKYPRKYSAHGIKLKILPGIFHPGLFYSTGVFIEFLGSLNIKGKNILELGAGSGLISFYCAKQGAEVTASDINPIAIDGLYENARKNELPISIVRSDLFENIHAAQFDMVLVNPPYYQKKPDNYNEMAWFCGEEFEYFERLFKQLSQGKPDNMELYMILSEDCNIEHIMKIANQKSFRNKVVYNRKVMGEVNKIFLFSFGKQD